MGNIFVTTCQEEQTSFHELVPWWNENFVIEDIRGEEFSSQKPN